MLGKNVRFNNADEAKEAIDSLRWHHKVKDKMMKKKQLGRIAESIDNQVYTTMSVGAYSDLNSFARKGPKGGDCKFRGSFYEKTLDLGD